MSIFWTFAIIYTIGNLLYFVAMITIDLTAKPKKAVSEEEVIEAGTEPAETTSVVENAGGGFSVLGGHGDSAETVSDFVAPPSEDEIDRSMVVGDTTEETTEDHSRYMPPAPKDDVQETLTEPSNTPEPPSDRTPDLSETSNVIVPDRQESAEDQMKEAPADPVQENPLESSQEDEPLVDNTDEATDGQSEPEHADDGFDLSRHIFDPDEDERRRKQAQQSFDEETAFTEHLVPNFAVTSTYYPKSSPSVEQEVQDINDSLEPIETRGNGYMAEDMFNIIKTGAAERLGMDYERF